MDGAFFIPTLKKRRKALTYCYIMMAITGDDDANLVELRFCILVFYSSPNIALYLFLAPGTTAHLNKVKF
jgi:hypothetical protein